MGQFTSRVYMRMFVPGHFVAGAPETLFEKAWEN
jgi:hypothetical protein